jgi:hypothetical protein
MVDTDNENVGCIRLLDRTAKAYPLCLLGIYGVVVLVTHDVTLGRTSVKH